MPVDPELYDRTTELSAAEAAAIDSIVHHRFPAAETKRGMRIYRDLDRLLRPLQDVLSVTKPLCHRMHISLFSFMAREMGKHQQSFWGWSAETWFETVAPNSHAFRKQAGRMLEIRKHLIAISYLLCGYSEFYRIGHVNQPIFAAMIFGKDIIDLAIERVGNELKSWGYIGAKISKGYLPNALCEALLVNRSPRLEDLTYEFLERLRQSDIAQTHKEALYYISRALASFGILKQALPPATAIGRCMGDSGALEGINSEWVEWCQRWYGTTTHAPKTAIGYIYILLSVGRWLAATHPEIVSPKQWTRELAAEYVAEVCRMTSCQWAHSNTNHPQVIGKPMAARTRNTRLGALRTFFRDCQEWGWIPRRFDPRRTFGTPRTIRAQIGPDPRVIADDMWAKLQWAGLNIAKDDLPVIPNGDGSRYPIEMVRAMSLVWLFCGLRKDEFKRLRCGCIRRLLEDITVAGISEAVSARKVCWLDVPTNKTSSSFTKPVDPAVGEAILAWEKVRPEQPASIDPKTGEVVHYLFFYRGHKLGETYLNKRLIPLLCRKAGVPETDARGAITSHRARATITSQLYNAREPMTIWELKEWLGHRYISSTEYYIKTSPTKLAKAYQDAGYFERNCRMIDLLIDQEAVRAGLAASGQSWKFYDLGHGYCAYDFFDKCPHRMACARCDFYIPKESTRAQIIEGKANLLRLKQEIPFTDEELAAIDDGIVLLEKLCEKLADVPTPSGQTPREIEEKARRELPILR
jgi:hypothetical protein